jgi:tight adherence protein C
MQYAAFAFLIVFLLFASGLLLLFYRDALGQRLSGILNPRSSAVAQDGFLDRIGMRETAEKFNHIASSIGKAAPKLEKDASAVRRRLILAGYRGDNPINIFYGFKAVVPVLLCVVTFVTGFYQWNPVLLFAMATGIGYTIPDFWLRRRIRVRQDAVREGLPDLLDLLVVCLEAGLSLDQAALRSSEEMRAANPVIADEIGLVMLEARAGQSRLEAWKRLADRTDVEAVRMLVSILVQADQFGTGISRTLRTHADTMRTRRRQQVEELAAKTTIKLIFPLVLCIFPAFFLVVLGPAAIMLMDVFAN